MKLHFKKKPFICAHMNAFKLLGIIVNTRKVDSRRHTLGVCWDFTAKQKSVGFEEKLSS